MNLHWPQITLIALVVFDAGIHLAKDGQPRTNFSFIAKLIDTAVVFSLLYYGGFFLGNSP
jgi:hypothetical protein